MCEKLEYLFEDAGHLDILEKCVILVDILNGSICQTDVSGKILRFFLALVDSPIGIWRDTLADKFELANHFLKFLIARPNTNDLDLGFKILIKLSNAPTKAPSHYYIENLIRFLLGHIKSDDPQQLPALEVLVNVRRHDPAVQDVLQSYVTVEDFYDLLVSLDGDDGNRTSVQVLRAMTWMSLTDIHGQDFISNNGANLLKLIFNRILHGDTDVKCNHLDLLDSLLETTSFVSVLRSYPHFIECFVMILNEVFTCGSQPVVMAKVFELLTAILRKPTLRPMLKSVMAAPISVALNWMGRRVEEAWKASVRAVHFLCELLDDGCSNILPDHFGKMVNTIKQ